MARMVYLLLWFTLQDILPGSCSSGRVGWKHRNRGRKYAYRRMLQVRTGHLRLRVMQLSHLSLHLDRNGQCAYRPAMSIQPSESILIVDFGSQVTQLIARRVREAGV